MSNLLLVISGHLRWERCRFTPKSRHVRGSSDIRFGPKADIRTSFDHLVGASHERGRDAMHKHATTPTD